MIFKKSFCRFKFAVDLFSVSEIHDLVDRIVHTRYYVFYRLRPEKFKQNIMPHLDNDLKNINEKDKSIESVSNILYNADRRATEICKTLSSEQSQSAAPAKKKQEEMEMCF